MLQGFCVFAMLCLHLFDRYDYDGLYQPLLYIKGIPLSFFVGQLSDFCVMGFAFCSGYAHLKLFGSEEKYYTRRLKSLLSLMIQFWIILIVFSLISYAVGNGNSMPGNVKRFFGNAFLYNLSYNGAWWYLYAYAGIVVLSPFLLKTVNRFPILSAVCSFALYCAAFYYRFHYLGTDLLLSKLGPFGMSLAEYLLGVFFYKYKCFSILSRLWTSFPKSFRYLLGGTIVCALLYIRTCVFPSLFFAPFSGIILIVLFHFWSKPKFVCDFFSILGFHSTNIWLTHMFFYSSMFHYSVYIARYPIAIILAMLIATIAISCLLKTIQIPMMKLIQEKR